MKDALNGKRLVMLGGASYTPFVKEYADKMGFHLFAAGNQVNEAMSAYTEEFFIAEASDADDVCELIEKEHIDGIVALGNEDIIACAIRVADRCNIPFYLNEVQWENLQDKANFKRLCQRFGVDVVEEYTVSDDSTSQELERLPYPLVFKPADSCGSKGITICDNAQQIRQAIEKARAFSRSERYVVERYMQGPEFIVSYIFVDGNIKVWMLGDRHMNTQQKGLGALSNLSVYPSRFSALYMEKVHPRMERLLKEYAPKNGTMFIQGFVDGDKIRFFDPGMRFCGTLDTIVYSHVCGINPLHWMVNHALSGRMGRAEELERMDQNLHGKTCAQLSILIHPGTIAKVEGLDAVGRLEGVVSVVELLEEGDSVSMVGTLQQVLARIHMALDDRALIRTTVEEIYRLVKVTDEAGRDMKMPCLIEYEI